MKFGDLLLGLAQGGGVGEGLGHGPARYPASQTKLRIMSRIVGFGAMAGRLAAASGHGGNATWPKITQAEEAFQELGAFSFKGREIVRHKQKSPF